MMMMMQRKDGIVPESDQTQELLNGAADGNPEAINQLMDRHRTALSRMVRMRMDQKLMRRVDVSDVVQDVLVEANRRLSSYLKKPKMAFHLWLRHIARDRIIDAHRRHRVSAKRSLDREQPMTGRSGDKSSILLANQLKDSQLTPEAAATQKEIAEQVELGIAKLDDRDAEIIILRLYEQLSNQEVASALSLSEPAASMRYLRAIRRLKEILVEAPGESNGLD
jgi:RNA polymerase sigma-70 factor, ECF subfamily